MLFDYDTFLASGLGGNVDIGTNCTPVGSASLSGGVWTVIGGGGDIFGTSDNFHFVAQSHSGDFTFSCRVATQQNTNSNAKAGIMFRNSLDPADVYYAVYMKPTSVSCEGRTTKGGNASSFGTVSSVSAPYYLQIVRTGNTFSANTSSDGSTWTLVSGSTQTIATANTAMLVGLANCSHSNGTANTSTFDNLSATITPVTNTWGSSTAGGTWTTNQGTPLLGISSTAGLIYSSSGDATMKLGSTTANDMEVTTQIILANSSDKVGVVARLSGSGSTQTWYGLRYYSGALHLEKNVAGTITALTTAVTTTMTVGTANTFRLVCLGTSIKGMFWQTSGTEPSTFTISATDSSIASGGYGVFCNATTSVPNTFGGPNSFYAQDGFITSNGTGGLVYNGASFRFSGGNCYWVGLQEVPTISYPTNNQVDEAFATLKEMGATVARCHTMGISIGNALSLETALATYNTGAFTAMDYALKRAGDYGLKLVIPLVDNWAYYHGGKHHFTDFRSDSNSPTVFYTGTNEINDFKAYCDQIMNRVNSITGVPYRDDSTILCWETGNELSYWPANGNPPDSSWVSSITGHIRNVDANHLIMSGTTPPQTSDFSQSNVDICTQHFYPLNNASMATNAAATVAGNKVYVVGEYDWTGLFGGDTLASFCTAVEGNTNIAGDLFWGLYGHADTGAGGYNEYGHSYTLYYPGENPTRAALIQQLRTHAYTMSGTSVPSAGTPAAPVLLAVNKVGHQWNPIWRGVPLATGYNVERSTTGPSGTWTTVATGITDWQLPCLINVTPGNTSWWRVKAANNAGVFGSYSNVIQVSYP